MGIIKGTKFFRLSRYPLWVLYTLGLGLMLLPLITVSLLSSAMFQQTGDLSNKLVEDSLAEVHMAMSLELSISEAAMPPNDYFIHGRPEEQENAQMANLTVEENFSRITSAQAWTPEQVKIIADARREWLKAKQIGEFIMKLKNPVGLPQGPDMMEQYDAQLELTNALVEKLHHIAMAESVKNHELLGHLNSKFTDVIFVALFVSLLLAIAGSILIIRAIFPALKQLQFGIKLFGEGQLDYRIGADMPLELQHVSEGLNEMVAKLQEIYSILEQQSLEDALTGAFNKRKLEIDFKHEVDRAHRYGHIFSMLIIDLDHFKNVNDTYGHPAGDSVLQMTVKQIRTQLRTCDNLYRYGGEEFIVLLPETGDEGAMVTGERIRSNMADCRIRLDKDKEIIITVSIGIAVYSMHGKNEIDLMMAADDALYAAKNGGRNRVCISGRITD